ncbi:hypothetical protein Droror1_Dr00028198 [Drosera rotundifolia]
MSSQYITGRNLLDKAIDLVDEACANVRVQLDNQPEEIDNFLGRPIQLEIELHALEKERRYLLKEFPELVSCLDHPMVLEVGYGNGSTILPIL